MEALLYKRFGVVYNGVRVVANHDLACDILLAVLVLFGYVVRCAT